MKILDIHTHSMLPNPQAVIALGVKELTEGATLLPGQPYSVGIHPWDTAAEITEDIWRALECVAALPQVVAIGECGIDATPRGGPMFRQMNALKRQIEISERLGKPMILHDVKGDEILIGLRTDLKPSQRWAIHGFRRKPTVAQMLLRAGCWLSFGEQFNAEALRLLPADRILAETDGSPMPIADIIANIDAAYGSQVNIATNTAKFLNLE